MGKSRKIKITVFRGENIMWTVSSALVQHSDHSAIIFDIKPLSWRWKRMGKNMKATLQKHLQITAAKFYFFQKVCLVWDHLLPQGTSWEIYVLESIPKNFLPTTSTSTQGKDIAMFCPKGYGSSSLLVITMCRVLILAISGCKINFFFR